MGPGARNVGPLTPVPTYYLCLVLMEKSPAGPEQAPGGKGCSPGGSQKGGWGDLVDPRQLLGSSPSS